MYGLGWRRLATTLQLYSMPLTTVRELDNQGAVFLFFVLGGRSLLAIKLDHLCRVENLYSAERRGMIASRAGQCKL